jgi:prepilin-type N-terminal cleavage/methylation domain-containing protein
MLKHPGTKREEGFSLVELLVVMVIMGAIGGIVVNAIVTSLSSARASTDRTMAIHEMEVALQRVARDLRAANPVFISAEERYHEQIGAAFLYDGRIRVVNFEVVHPEPDAEDQRQRLVQETTVLNIGDDIDDVDPDAMQSQHTLVTTIDNGDEPLFRYYDESDNLISCVDECDAAYASARKLGIRLVRDVTGQSPVVAETRIHVRNTRYESR